MDEQRKEPFGVLLRRYRRARGWTQAQLAERANVSVEAVGALERGTRRAPWPDTVIRLTEALELSGEEQMTLTAAADVARLNLEQIHPSEARQGGSAGEDAAIAPGAVDTLFRMPVPLHRAATASARRLLPSRLSRIHARVRHQKAMFVALSSLVIAGIVLSSLLHALQPTHIPALGRPLAGWGKPLPPTIPLLHPSDAAIDRQGNVYVADTENDRIVKYSPGGRQLSVWGEYGIGPGEFDQPDAIAVDGQGYIYVSDSGNHRTQRLSPTGRAVGEWYGAPNWITVAPDGDLYVANRDEFVRRTPGGKFLDTCCQNDPIDPSYPLMVDAQGDIWGYYTGSENGAQSRIFVMRQSPGNAQLSSWPLPFNVLVELGPSHCCRFVTGLSLDAQHHVYLASHRYLYKFSAAGALLARWSLTQGGPAQDLSPRRVLTDRKGNVYVVDSKTSRILKFLPSGKQVPGWGESTAYRGLSNPMGVTVGPHGEVYVADTGHGRVQLFSPQGVPLATLSKPGSATRTAHPWGIATDSAGRVYVSDAGTGCIDIFVHDTFWKSLVTAVSIMVVGQSVTQYREVCTLTRPTGIAVRRDGTVYVAEAAADAVDTLGSAGLVRDTLGTVGQGPGRFAEPVAVALDGSGAIYVVDRTNHCIQKLTGQGEARSLWGGPGPHDGSSAPGRFRNPSGIAVDGAANVYVADTGNDRIEEFSPTGKLLAMQGNRGSGPGQFLHPSGIAADGAGDVYVADTGNNRVQKIIHEG